MSPLQMAQQIKHQLEQAVWPVEGGQLVFGAQGSVAVVAGAITEEQVPIGLPFALVVIDNGTHDEENPDYLTQQFTVVTVAESTGDRMGEFALIGSAAASLTGSAGRGVLEVAEQTRSAIQNLTGVDGATVQLSGNTILPPLMLGNARHVARQDVTLQAMCTSTSYYAPPARLRWSAGVWAWDGDHCAARFDHWDFVLMRKFGTQPSNDTSDGYVLYTGDNQEFEAVQENGYTYTVFARYSARGNANLDGISAPETGSYRVV